MGTEAMAKARKDALAFAPGPSQVRIWPSILLYAPTIFVLIGMVAGYLLCLVTT